ncbi:hypothetical protein GMDG_08699 [Pseudogymnoascus destructans 20631-21]|uniref:Uncharacterized protein n=1 Tax=Pseudogymnoascus destructans (strain ATCC MYA-4855 / 20631-21) TaxID=658429 RepID=L8G8W7_PSED2|nr:hypothetical protein GMDG_08699 [Pseudogymnoascus destructans 20631-21]
MKAGVWRYIDPNNIDPPILEPPTRPAPSFVRAAAQAGQGFATSSSSQQAPAGVATRGRSSAQQPQQSVEDQQQLSSQLMPITYASLTEDQKEELRNLQDDYQHDRKMWEKQEEAVQGIRTKIQESIKRDFLPYTYGCDSAHAMLVNLKTRFAPTDRGRIEEWKSEWRTLQKIPKGSTVDDWLLRWETISEVQSLPCHHHLSVSGI